MTRPRDDKTAEDNFRPLLLAIVGVLVVQVFVGWLIYRAIGGWEQRGQFGDMFGAVNTFFSGLAFAGVIYAILLQRTELSLQRKELELTRRELEKSAEAQERSAGLLAEQLRLMEEQLELARSQTEPRPMGGKLERRRERSENDYWFVLWFRLLPEFTQPRLSMGSETLECRLRRGTHEWEVSAFVQLPVTSAERRSLRMAYRDEAGRDRVMDLIVAYNLDRADDGKTFQVEVSRQ